MSTRDDVAVLRRLSLADRLLPLWIAVAMVAGLGLGRAVPSLSDRLLAIQVGSVSLPIAFGLLVMMYPVLAKVRYRQLGTVTADRRLLGASLLLNWIVGPAVMFTLAWSLLPDLPAYRTGLIIVGLARCIAMVLIWNDLACGDREVAAVLVALNSLFQLVAFAALGWFYLHVLPGWLGLHQTQVRFSTSTIAISVLVFLGIPLVAGILSRILGEAARGREWYERRFLPRISPLAVCGLLFTVVALFALQGHAVTSHPADVARIALPLLVYFAVMFCGGFVVGHRLGLGYAKTTTLAFTAAGNNFELAIATTIAVFGATSGQALAGVVGPLIEVPVLVALVYVALWLRGRRTWPDRLDGSVAMPPVPEVLFVCVHNAGRSQMAAALLDRYAAGRVQVRSAGSDPADGINPAVVAVMAEVGVDLSREFPKPLTLDAVEAADVVVTMGCGDACPVYPAKRYLDWQLPDPAQLPIEEIRPIRDAIDSLVRSMVDELMLDRRDAPRRSLETAGGFE